MKPLLIMLIQVVCYLNPAFSNPNTNIDNFWDKINVFKTTKHKIKDLENLANKYIDQGEFNKAWQSANRGLTLSIKKNAQENISDFYYILGRICFLKNQMDSDIFYCN
jgi:hypothetical protein